jgi:predicted  nucleic acid-binding Zn-ribbon protein
MKRSIIIGSLNWIIAAGILWLVIGCESTYYKTMETMGYHKRDIMVDRVEDARDAQQEAKDQFESALEQFSTVLNFQGGDLEEKYDQLKSEYEASEKKAQEVRLRIDEVEDVAGDLFAEWQEELDQYTSSSLRKSSARKLAETKRQYAKLIGAMKRAERKIDPVLNAFRDQVLYLKHNLNAQAIASLQSELVSIESDVAKLIREMEASIKEANEFISSMQ